MLSDAPILYVVSGAGLSAESGISTFRDKEGTWARFDIDKVCLYDTWQQNREAVFDFYEQRLTELQTVVPNEGHRALAEWQARWGALRVRLLTQNVDHLLEAAGASHVTHLHGDLRDLRCVECEYTFRVAFSEYSRARPCPACGKVETVKPGVIFFREAAPAYSVIEDMREALRPQDIVLVVGTSLAVLTAYQLLPLRRKGHERNWQVNPQPDDEDWFGANLKEPSSTGLRALETQLVAMMDESEELGADLAHALSGPPMTISSPSLFVRILDWLRAKTLSR